MLISLSNVSNVHKMFTFLFSAYFGGDFLFSNGDVLRVNPDLDTMSLRIFGGIGSIRLESRKNSLRLHIAK